MIVAKFGGTSVGDAERIQNVVAITRAQLQRKPVLVVSAHSKVTDQLVALAEAALHGHFDVGPLRERHQKIIRDLGVDSMIEPLFAELEGLLKGISMVKELTPRTRDYVLSFGERLSVRTIAAYFNKCGLPAVPVDAFDLGLVTDSNFGSASPLPEGDALMAFNVKRFDKLPIVTGYVGKDRNGDITTLGRNGSDYSATILGGAIDAEEVQIWTDVDGVLTADPRIVPEAVPLGQMSFGEASELAYYGGKVLHPLTLIPAVRKDIPVRVLNTFKPQSKGTVILRECPPEGTVKSIVSKDGIYLISIVSLRMLLHHGFMAKIFEIFGRYRIVIDMIATSEVSVSLTTDDDESLEPAVKELSAFADVTVQEGMAIVCAVGDGMRRAPGVAAEVLGALRGAGVDPLMISQGATRVNLAFLVESPQVRTAVHALHDHFFPRGARAAADPKVS
ncbi:MAG: aspartate kinase [Planctomycetes bacterium]|nr:aspartate kinase [Planctomycetota bacterium]